MTLARSAGRPRKDVSDRFLSKVRRNDNGCWEWTGSLDGHGYGSLQVYDPVLKRWRLAKAHRVAYELHIGPIGEGLQIDHLCRNRRCVNPVHLEAVTPGENIRRGVQARFGRPPKPRNMRLTQRGPRSVCGRGHPMASPNLYTRPGGKPECWECKRIRHRAYKKRLIERR